MTTDRTAGTGPGTVRVVQFLSREWLAALNDATADHGGLAALGDGGRFVLQQTVTGGPDGDVHYRFEIDDEGTRAILGPVVDPTVTCRQDYATAVGIATGQTSAQSAFMHGDLVIGGNLAELIARAEVLAGIDDVFAEVRSQTIY